MKILALDSSGLVASVALIEDQTLIAEYTINHKKTHSQTLIPMLDEVKRMVELDLATIDGIAVAAGPGSFTGLRIGAATAKGLGLALGKPIVPVPTIDGLAYNMYGTADVVCPIMDARRGQVYTGLYEFVFENGTYRMECIKEQCAVMMDEIIEEVNKIGRRVIFLGDGVPVFSQKIKEKILMPYSFAPASMNRQKAASVGALGCLYYEQGKVQEASEHAPEYLRVSQAERERKEKEKGIGEV